MLQPTTPGRERGAVLRGGGRRGGRGEVVRLGPATVEVVVLWGSAVR